MLIKNTKTTKNENKLDEEIIKMANNEKAWDKNFKVSPQTMPTSIRLSARTIEKAKFFAKIHHERGYQSWIKKIIEEHVNTEYEMYRKLRKEFA